MGKSSTQRQMLGAITPKGAKAVLPYDRWKQLEDVSPAVRRLARAVEGLAPVAAKRLAEMLDDIIVITDPATGEPRNIPRVPENMRFAIKEVMDRTMPRREKRDIKVDVKLEDAHLLALKRLVDAPIIDAIAEVVEDDSDDDTEPDDNGGY